MTHEQTQQTPEKYLCFRREYGFAQYNSDTGAIHHTLNVESAHEASKDDWSDVIGLDLTLYKFVPSNISFGRLKLQLQQVTKERDELKEQAPSSTPSTEWVKKKDVVPLVEALQFALKLFGTTSPPSLIDKALLHAEKILK